jgi:hypothetical protein
MAIKAGKPATASPEQNVDTAAEEQREQRIEAAKSATAKAEEEGRLPETMAVTNPAPATEMDAASGAFIEPEIKNSIPVDHPAIENNPRAGTSAVQNGGDFNDPKRRHPSDPDFAGQGLDMSVYGKTGEAN